jgi:hypothetical protein
MVSVMGERLGLEYKEAEILLFVCYVNIYAIIFLLFLIKNGASPRNVLSKLVSHVVLKYSYSVLGS